MINYISCTNPWKGIHLFENRPSTQGIAMSPNQGQLPGIHHHYHQHSLYLNRNRVPFLLAELIVVHCELTGHHFARFTDKRDPENGPKHEK